MASQVKSKRRVSPSVRNSTNYVPGMLAPQSTYRQGLTAGLTSVFLIVLYLLTLQFNRPGGDGAELIATSFLGLPSHPPGYPLLSLMGRVFSLGASQDPIIYYQVLNLLLSLGSLVFLVLFVRRLGFNLSIACISAVAVGINEYVWQSSVIYEVFALHNFIVVCFLYGVLGWFQTRHLRFFVTSCLFAGLGVAHHQFIIFLLLGLGLPVLAKTHKDLKNFKTLGAGFFAFVIGLCPYGYLAWQLKSADIASWGSLTSFGDFWHFVLRRDYGTFSIATGAGGGIGWGALWAYLMDFGARQTFGFGALLGVLGIVCSFKYQPGLRLPITGIVSATCLHMIVFHLLLGLDPMQPVQYEIVTKMWSPLNFLVLLWVGPGLGLLWERLRNQQVARILLVPLVGIWIAFLVYSTFESMKSRNDSFHEKLAAGVFSEVPEGGWLLATGDPFIHTTFYDRYVLGIRPDIRWLPLSRLTYPWFRLKLAKAYPELNIGQDSANGYNLRHFIEANEASLPFYITFLSASDYEQLVGRYRLARRGFVTEITPMGVATPVATELFVNQLRRFQELKLRSYHRFSWQAVLLRIFFENLQVHCDALLAAAANDKSTAPYDDIITLTSTALEWEGVVPPSLYRYLGYAYFKKSAVDPTLLTKSKIAYAQYLKLGQPETAEREQLKRFLDP